MPNSWAHHCEFLFRDNRFLFRYSSRGKKTIYLFFFFFFYRSITYLVLYYFAVIYKRCIHLSLQVSVVYTDYVHIFQCIYYTPSIIVSFLENTKNKDAKMMFWYFVNFILTETHDMLLFTCLIIMRGVNTFKSRKDHKIITI